MALPELAEKSGKGGGGEEMELGVGTEGEMALVWLMLGLGGCVVGILWRYLELNVLVYEVAIIGSMYLGRCTV